MAESQRGGSRDNVDGLPDFQVNLDRRGIADLLHAPDVVDRIDRLCSGGDGQQQPKEWERVGMFVRRYSATTRPWMPFHCDGNAYTANIALSVSSDHEGGTLLCLVGGGVHACVRTLGTATVHGGGVCHAVTPVTAGTRYALLVFFHDTVSDTGAGVPAWGNKPTDEMSSKKRHAGIQEL
jgi:hypothetical protein